MYFEFPQTSFNCVNIHKGLINMGEVICLMCDDKLIDIPIIQKNIEKCIVCDSTSLVDDNGVIVCTSCGYVNDYLKVLDASFYDSHRMSKKSIYRSTYYVKIVLNNISKKHRIQIPVRVQILICRVIELIRASEELMQTRKRIISFKYIIRCILKQTNLNYDFIPQIRCKLTRKKYNVFWKRVMKSDVGDMVRNCIV